RHRRDRDADRGRRRPRARPGRGERVPRQGRGHRTQERRYGHRRPEHDDRTCRDLCRRRPRPQRTLRHHRHRPWQEGRPSYRCLAARDGICRPGQAPDGAFRRPPPAGLLGCAALGRAGPATRGPAARFRRGGGRADRGGSGPRVPPLSLLRQLLRVRPVLRRLSRGCDRETRPRPPLPFPLRPLHRLCRLLRGLSLPCHRDDPGAGRMNGRPGIRTVMDGNTAVAHVAYRVNEVCAIYPITPSSTMAELADQWSAEGLRNIWGNIPVVQEMQSEGGAAGAVHGALQSGAMTTTFTASQGLMLMLPNMMKIAGELTATVFHVAARALATSALSIFGDHSDVMTARTTGFALLSSGNVQEAHDAALIAQAATLKARIPFLHFFDGFRTSHELNTLFLLGDDDIRAMISDDLVRAHRARALDPEHPFVRGTAHNPDTFFQAREAVTPYYNAVPGIVSDAMERFAALTGRRYRLFEYEGAPDAERVLILMGSGAETARETVKVLAARGEKVGAIQLRLYRPFSAADLLAALPATASAIAVLEQTKESGAPGEPLYLDVVSALAAAAGRGERATMPFVVGGRYGLSSKNFPPSLVKAALDELARRDAGGRCVARHGFTLGIDDDVSHSSLAADESFSIEPDS